MQKSHTGALQQHTCQEARASRSSVKSWKIYQPSEAVLDSPDSPWDNEAPGFAPPQPSTSSMSLSPYGPSYLQQDWALVYLSHLLSREGWVGRRATWGIPAKRPGGGAWSSKEGEEGGSERENRHGGSDWSAHRTPGKAWFATAAE